MEHFEFSDSHKDQTLIEYQTLSSQHSVQITERSERLHEWLKSQEIENLHKKFLNKGKLTYSELREELENLNIIFTDIEYNRLFLKINQNRDFKCDWNEFISYLIFGFQDDDPSTQKESLILPISEAPIIKKSEHRSPVCGISLLKNVSDLIVDDDEEELSRNKRDLLADEEIDEEAEEMKRKMQNLAVNDTAENTGIWITASKEGQIRFWSPLLEPLRSGMSESCKFSNVITQNNLEFFVKY